MHLELLLQQVTACLAQTFSWDDIQCRLSNWEDEWGERRYCSMPTAKINEVVEQACLKGSHLELEITVQLGTLSSFPEDQTEALRLRQQWFRRQELEHRYERKRKALQWEFEQELERLKTELAP